MIQYTLTPEPAAHLWRVCLSFYSKDNRPLQIKLPNWVPGSYLIRDFSRHIIGIEASCNSRPVVLEQVSKNGWTVENPGGEWQIHYTVYAFDLSVRGSFLSAERGFFDGACLLLRVEGYENRLHQITFPQLPEN